MRCSRCKRQLRKPNYFQGGQYGVKCIVKIKKEAQKNLVQIGVITQ